MKSATRDELMTQLTIAGQIAGHLARVGEKHSADTLQQIVETMFKLIPRVVRERDEELAAACRALLTEAGGSVERTPESPEEWLRLVRDAVELRDIRDGCDQCSEGKMPRRGRYGWMHFDALGGQCPQSHIYERRRLAHYHAERSRTKEPNR